MVDDHLIDSVRSYFNAAYEDLKKDWKSNTYKRLADCPSFKTAAAYRDAMNVLIKGCYHPEAIESQLKKILDEELEIENHWKEHRK